MILATHALTGAAIGKNFENLWLIIALSIIMHFVMDSFRHGEYFDSRIAKFKDIYWKTMIDLSIAGIVILSFIIFYNPTHQKISHILFGSFFSILPDFFTVLYWKFHWKILKKIKIFHSFCHRYSRFPKFSPERQWTLRNAFNDILISTLAISFLFFINF